MLWLILIRFHHCQLLLSLVCSYVRGINNFIPQTLENGEYRQLAITLVQKTINLSNQSKSFKYVWKKQYSCWLLTLAHCESQNGHQSGHHGLFGCSQDLGLIRPRLHIRAVKWNYQYLYITGAKNPGKSFVRVVL